MTTDDEECYTFLVEWYDNVAQIRRNYNLSYWPRDNSCSMFDIVKRRLFLKRLPCLKNAQITSLSDLMVGRTVVVFSRHLSVVSYADKITADKFHAIFQTTKILFFDSETHSSNSNSNSNSDPNVFQLFSQFFAYLHHHSNSSSSSTNIKHVKSIQIKQTQMQTLSHKFPKLSINNMNNQASNIVICAEFIGTNVAKIYNQWITADADGAMSSNNRVSKTVLVSDASLFNEVKDQSATSALMNDSSFICLIKPHAFVTNACASIITDIIDGGFNVTAIRSVSDELTLANAQTFMSVYKTVVKEYSRLIEQLLSGAFIVLELASAQAREQGSDGGVVALMNNTKEFREFAGPRDPSVARHIRPQTLRAKYGVDRIKNAVHSTDLQEDGILESQFFFQHLDQQKQTQNEN